MSAAAAPARDPLYDREQQRAFCARLRDFGHEYAALSGALERIGLPRPSAGTGAWRALLVTAARNHQGSDAHTLADAVAPLYRPQAHLWMPLPADDDGYLDSLTADLPATSTLEPENNNMARKPAAAAPAAASLFPAPPPVPGVDFTPEPERPVYTAAAPVEQPAPVTAPRPTFDPPPAPPAGRWLWIGGGWSLVGLASGGTHRITGRANSTPESIVWRFYGTSVIPGGAVLATIEGATVEKVAGELFGALISRGMLPSPRRAVVEAAPVVEPEAVAVAVEPEAVAVAVEPEPVAVVVEPVVEAAPVVAVAAPTGLDADEEDAELYLDQIHIDTGIQTRAATSEATIARYAELMGAGVRFPPVLVFGKGGVYWLADGFHRVEAAKRAGVEMIRATIKPGNHRDALYAALAANREHGLARTNEDVARIMRLVLADREWSAMSDRKIAQHVGVTHPTVSRWRKVIEAEARGETVERITTPPVAVAAPVAVPVEPEIPADPMEISDPILCSRLLADPKTSKADRESLTTLRHVLEIVAGCNSIAAIFKEMKKHYGDRAWAPGVLTAVTARVNEGGESLAADSRTPDELRAQLDTEHAALKLCTTARLDIGQVRAAHAVWAAGTEAASKWGSRFDLTYCVNRFAHTPGVRARVDARIEELRAAEPQQEIPKPKTRHPWDMWCDVKAETDPDRQAEMVRTFPAEHIDYVVGGQLIPSVRDGAYRLRVCPDSADLCPDPGCGWIKPNGFCVNCGRKPATTQQDIMAAIGLTARVIGHPSHRLTVPTVTGPLVIDCELISALRGMQGAAEEGELMSHLVANYADITRLLLRGGE